MPKRSAMIASVLWVAGVARAADIPPAIAAPPACKLLFKLHADGVQIYKATAGPTGLKWTLDGPLATLTDDGVVGYHFDGPTWESADGSRVVIDPKVPVKSAPAFDAKHDIPWLLVKVKRDGDAPGKLATVDYVQRTETAGGTAPDTPPMRLGTRVGVPYTATYCFYGKAD